MIQVWAKDLDQGSYDNCTPSHRLDVRIYHLALGSPPTTLGRRKKCLTKANNPKLCSI